MLKGFYKSPTGTSDDGGETLVPRSVPIEGMNANIGGQPVAYTDSATLEGAFSGLSQEAVPLNPATERARAQAAAVPMQPSDHRPGTVHPLRTEVGLAEEGSDQLVPEAKAFKAFNEECRAQLDWIGNAVQAQRSHHLHGDGTSESYALAA